MSVLVLSDHSSFLKPFLSTRHIAYAGLPGNRCRRPEFLVPMKPVGSLRCADWLGGNPCREHLTQSHEEAQTKPTEFTRWQAMLPVVTSVMAACDPKPTLSMPERTGTDAGTLRVSFRYRARQVILFLDEVGRVLRVG
jgi:hypothetical protein